MRVLIIGGGGFLGQKIAKSLGKSGTLRGAPISHLALADRAAPARIEDWTANNPQTSYGAQKAAAELLLTDYSRKGFLDGRGPRLPTVTIRPGKANAAASSFISSIFREPLQGEDAICPVEPDFELWYASPRVVTQNLIRCAEIDEERLGQNRCFALPGKVSTIGEMIEAMRAVAGDEPVGRIRFERDKRVYDNVMGRPPHIHPQKAFALGLKADDSFEDNIRYFLEDDIRR